VLNRRDVLTSTLSLPIAAHLPAFDAEVYRAFDGFVPDLTRVATAPQGSLRSFVETHWPVVEPDQAFVPNWHIDALCAHLEAVTRGTITHLLVNIPPGCMKSLVVSVFWPAWEWAQTPGLRYLCASYDEGLSIRDSLRVRDIIQSREYHDQWPHVRVRADQNQKRQFQTSAGGWRMATTVQGRGTGQHPDRIIVDDPHNVSQTLSDVERHQAIDWFDGTLSTRGVSRNARVVVIMQRLHEDDLSGHILRRADKHRWVHLCLPMEYEAARMPATPLGWTDPRTTPGELLWPALFGRTTVTNLQAALGSFRSAGQLQQRPAPAEGGLLKRGWWKFYAPRQYPTFERIVISCDPNLRAKELNDPAGLQTWGARGADRYLLRREVGRWDVPELTKRILDEVRWVRETFGADVNLTTLVENTAAGPDVILALKRKISVIGVKPKGDKVQRLHAVSPSIEAGNAFLPGAPHPSGLGEDPSHTPVFVQQFLAQCAAFPFAQHDEDVDCLTQAFLRLQSATHVGGARVEWLI